MTVLVIHPADRSTTFLDGIYKDIEDKTVITGGVTKEELKHLIESHDRVMIMGHGSPRGLFNVSGFKCHDMYIIDYTMVEALSKKDNSVFIWCNADQFINQYKLKGFFSKMFISERLEADYCGVFGTDQQLIDESNYGFVNILAECINESNEVIHKTVVEKYNKLAEENENPVAYYNASRLCLNL